MAPLIAVKLFLVFLLTLGGLVVGGEYENEPVCSHGLETSRMATMIGVAAGS